MTGFSVTSLVTWSDITVNVFSPREVLKATMFWR